MTPVTLEQVIFGIESKSAEFVQMVVLRVFSRICMLFGGCSLNFGTCLEDSQLPDHSRDRIVDIVDRLKYGLLSVRSVRAFKCRPVSRLFSYDSSFVNPTSPRRGHPIPGLQSGPILCQEIENEYGM
jgi:hypothetical protein